jgi:probable phosphoglycerate mutase
VKQTEIAFVRHGQVHNPRGVYYGRTPRYRLSEEGRRQAQATAEHLRDKPLAAVFSSPLLRARQTARIILEHHNGVPLRTSRLLNEVCTPFDGYTLRELDAIGWDLYNPNSPEYEQPPDVLKRVQRFLARVRNQYAGQSVAAVSHGDVIAFTMLWAMGLPVTVKTARRELVRLDSQERYVATGSISTLIFKTTDPDEIPAYTYVRPYSR